MWGQDTGRGGRRAWRVRAAVAAAAVMATMLWSVGGASAATPEFFNGFETDAAGWTLLGGTFDATRVPSGTNGITSRSGSFHAQAAQSQSGSAFTRWGGSSSVFPSGGYVTRVDVYLDLSAITVTQPADSGVRFDWTSAINNSAGMHRRDFVFNVGGYTTADSFAPAGNHFVISASNNATRSGADPRNAGKDPVAIATTGWYTFQHRFYENGGVLAADLSIVNQGGVTLKTWTLSDPGDTIATIGGWRYGWFVFNEFPVLAFDNSFRSGDVVPAPPTPPEPSPEVVLCRDVPASIIGTDAAETIRGTDGRDVIVAGAGDDIVESLGGDDIVCGNEGEDVVRGGKGNDLLRGNRDADRLEGQNGDDELHADGGEDGIDGGRGDDFLQGGSDFDRCSGGTGENTFRSCQVRT